MQLYQGQENFAISQNRSMNQDLGIQSFGNFWFPISIRQVCQLFLCDDQMVKLEKVELVTLHKTYT